MSSFHHALGANFGVRSLAAFVEGPILLAFDYKLYDGMFGWQLPLLALLAVLAMAGITSKRLRRQALWPAIVAACLYVFWYFTAQQARFLVPGALASMPVAAAGLRRFGAIHRKILFALLLAAAVVSLPWRNAGYYFGSWLAASGVVKPSEYLRISLARDASDNEYLPLLRALTEHTPPDAKIIVLFEHRMFYFPRRHVIATPFFQELSFTPPEQFTTVEDFMKVFRREQATHVLISNAPAGPDQASGYFDRLEHFLPLFGECRKQGKLRIVWESPRYILLAIEPSPV